MEMSFRKLPDNQHEILVRREKGPDVRLPAQPAGPSMPHDLVHAVAETPLGIDDGFWGATARGATFQGFELVTPGRHRRSGMKVLRRSGDAVMDAEPRVNWAYRAWSGLPTEGRGVGRAPLDAEALVRTGPRLDAAGPAGPPCPSAGNSLGAGEWTAEAGPGHDGPPWPPTAGAASRRTSLRVTTAVPGPPPRTPAACGC
ncbi:hypothetical protein [Streptomyces pseudogriseolus]|uniref:hypothetical protein n=1 Tax=Streptomyces pseudogriseolus TaxID=36817 RepID=UPI001CE26664|nr:hypothetical protein [Streptomyces pseudogriseolus]